MSLTTNYGACKVPVLNTVLPEQSLLTHTLWCYLNMGLDKQKLGEGGIVNIF